MTAQQTIAARKKARLDNRYKSQRSGDPSARAKHEREKVERERLRAQRKKDSSKK